ncbi:MAG: preprotein translocase subunit SecG [Bacilli bacterium]
MTIWDILLIIVSSLLIIMIILMESKEDASAAFTGEKSELFANKKQRGFELWIDRAFMICTISFFVLSIVTAYFVDRLA